MYFNMLFVILLSFAVFQAKSVYQTQFQTETDDRYSRLLKRVESLEKRDTEQQVEIDFLRAELSEEKKKTAELEGIIQVIRQELEGSKALLTPDGPALKDVNSSENDGPRIRQAQPEVVAFHAVRHEHLQNVGLRQNIAFEKVITNIGGAYNAHFGSFVAPVSGVYVFSSTITGLTRDTYSVGILRNGVLVGNMHIRNVESPYENDSALVVLQLHKGDDVAIQSETSTIAINGNSYSMFSGFLLVPYEG